MEVSKSVNQCPLMARYRFVAESSQKDRAEFQRVCAAHALFLLKYGEVKNLPCHVERLADPHLERRCRSRIKIKGVLE